MLTLRDDIESLVYFTGFCCEDRAFHWKSFLKNCFVQNSRARCPTIVLGSIRKDIVVNRMALANIVKFLLISAGVGFSFIIFIQFENHFGNFNGWCLWKSAFASSFYKVLIKDK